MARTRHICWACLVPIFIVLPAGCGGNQTVEQTTKQTVEHEIASSPPAGEPLDTRRWTDFSNPSSTVGETVYVPVYSSVFHQAGDREFLLTSTLSIHNTDLTESIAITDVAYFNTQGRRIRDFIDEEIVLGPLATKQFVIPQNDNSGGTGANFLVKWEAEGERPRPIIESLMLSTSSQQGLSFVCQGTVIRTLRTPQTTDTAEPGDGGDSK